MSVMSNVREESLEEGLLLDARDSDSSYAAGDLSLPEDLRWRPGPSPAIVHAPLSAAKSRRARASSGAWLDGLYLLLGATSAVVAVQQVIASLSR